MRTDSDSKDPLFKKRRGRDTPSARERSVNRTVLLEEMISPQKMYRIAVLGFWWQGKMSNVLGEAYQRIFEEHDGPRIALHAGVLTSGKRWPRDPDDVCKAAKGNGVNALFEVQTEPTIRAYMACDQNGRMLDVQIFQRFGDSSQANRDPAMVAELVQDCGPNGERTINLAGLPLGLLVCGENNVLTNEQYKDNRALVRHQPDAQLFEGVRVVFNGAHTPMGNWGKLDRRYKYLSRARRWAFYATNCENYDWGRGTARGYYNGQLVLDSSGRQPTAVNGVRVQRILDDESQDRYLALVFDIPGKLLQSH